MRGTSIALAATLWASVFANSLSAQPILNRVEQLLRDQIGGFRKPAAAQASQPSEPGYLGLTADDRQDQGQGVRILELVPGGPAAKAGLKVGDLITSIGGQAIRVMADVDQAMQGQVEGTRLIVVVKRGETDRQQEVTLGRRPPAKPAGADAEELPHPTEQVNDGPAAAQGPLLGVRTLNVNEQTRRQNKLPDANGAVVVSVTEGSPAERDGIPTGAVILAFDGKPVNTPQDLAAAVRAAGAREVEVKYVYQGQAARMRVSLAPTAALADGPKREVRGRPIGNPVEVLPSDGGALEAPAAARTTALEARIAELEARIAKLEAAIAGDAK